MAQPSRDDIEPIIRLEERFAALLDPLIEREKNALGLGDRKELTQEEHDLLVAAVAEAATEIVNDLDDELLIAAARRGLLSMVLEVQAERSSN